MPIQVTSRMNPFSPDQPVDWEYFAGREEEFQAIMDCLFQTKENMTHHIFITGERGIGKTSLAKITMAMSKKDVIKTFTFNYLTVNCTCDSNDSLDDICVKILKDLRKNTDTTIWEKFREKFSEFELKIWHFGIAAKTNTQEKELDISKEFPFLLEKFFDGVKESFDGILVVVDELDRISDKLQIGSFFKSLFEKLNLDSYKRIMFLLCGLNKAYEDLVEQHESLNRAFRFIELGYMTNKESKEIILKALVKASPKVEIDGSILEKIAHITGGMPYFVQQVGYSVFNADVDHFIDEEDYMKGLGIGKYIDVKDSALEQLARKRFNKIYVDQFRSNAYREVLKIMAGCSTDIVTKEFIRKKFKGKATKLNNAINALRDRNAIKSVPGKKGEYELASRLFKEYLRMRTLAEDYTLDLNKNENK